MGDRFFRKTGKMYNLYRFNDSLLGGIWGAQRVVVTEKIHGTQARIFIFPDEVKVGTRKRVIGPEVRSYPQQYEVTHAIGESVRRQLLAEGEIPGGQVTIFGEYAGEGIQKGIKYTESGKGFWAFAVLIGESMWLDTLESLDFCSIYGIKFVPFLYAGPPDMELFNSLYDQNSFVLRIEDNVMEGIVITSQPLMFDTHGSIVQAKHKNEKWSESIKKTKKPRKASEEMAYARENVNEVRVLHAVDKLREEGVWQRSMVDMRNLIMVVMVDLKQEVGLGELDETNVRRSISKLVANLYKAMLSKGDLL